MSDDEAHKVLAEILGQQSAYSDDDTFETEELAPGFELLTELAGLLAAEVREEELQRFFAANPEFLLAFVPRSRGSELAFLAKPPIGTAYNADFAILAAGQAGSSTILIELERASSELFTADLIEAKPLRIALGQVKDWQQWINENKSTFTRDLLRLACEAPQYPDRSKTGSFRLFSADDLMRYWDGFGSVNEPGASYSVLGSISVDGERTVSRRAG